MKDSVMKFLSGLPGAIEDHEFEVEVQRAKLNMAENALEDRKAALLTSGEIAGRNEEERKARLRIALNGELQRVSACEAALEEAKRKLRRVQNEFSAAKAMAGLLAGGAA